jgi:hypothetical protein
VDYPAGQWREARESWTPRSVSEMSLRRKSPLTWPLPTTGGRGQPARGGVPGEGHIEIFTGRGGHERS